jgi:hypothetical protein
MLAELAERLPALRVEQVEELAAAGVGERLEDFVGVNGGA